MRTFSVITLMLLLVQVRLMAGGIVPSSRWRTQAIQIDGHDNDWEKPINFYDAQTGLFFAIRNDSSTLYLNFTATDPEKMMSLMQAGWSLSFQAKNKKGKTKGQLSFQPSAGPRQFGGAGRSSSGGAGERPQGNNRMQSMSESAGPEANATMPDLQQINNYRLSFRQFTASGFIFTHGQVPVFNKTGIVVGAGQSDPSGLFYEMAIPLVELFDEGSVKLNEKISLQIAVNAMSRPQGESGPPSMEGESGRSMGGPPSNASVGESSSTSKTTFKQVFRLTSK